MTTEAIAPLLASKRARASELTTQKEAIEKIGAEATSAIARALAAGRTGDKVDAARRVSRSAGDEAAEISHAIELLISQIAQLERDRKQAEKIEAAERAERSATEAQSAMNALHAGLKDAAGKIRTLKSRADSAMRAANGDHQVARSLNGQAPGMFERFHFHNSPGVLELVNDLVKFA